MAISGIDSATEKIRALQDKIKQLEKSNSLLQKKAAYFDEHLKYMPHIYYRFNLLTHQYDYISPKLHSLTGYTVEEFKKKSIEDANKETHPDDIQQVLQQIEELHKSTSTYSSTKLICRRKIKNGTYLWIEDNLTLIKDENLNPVCYIGNVKDISKQKIKELKYQEDKKLNQFILDSNPNIIYVKNAQARYVMANKAMADFFEIEQKDLIKRLNSDFADRNINVDIFDKTERKVLQTGLPATYEEKFTSPSGKIHYLQTTKTPLKIPGESPFVLVNSTDITDKKIAENKLKLSEALYKNLIESLNFPFIMFNEAGKLKIINKSGLEWLHLDNKEWEGIHWEKIAILKKIANACACDLSKIESTIDFEVQVEINSNPVWLWCNLQAVYDHNQDKIGFQAIIFDITSRKNNIEKLRQNEITFRGIINASDDLIFLIDKKARIITANEAAQRFCNLSVDEMRYKNAAEIFGPERGKFRQDQINKVFEIKKDLQVEEQMEDKVLMAFLYPIFNEQKEVYQIAVMVRDVTTLKKAEAEVLNALNKEKELNALRSGVISTVSHEFRTPLAVILSNIQVVQKYHNKLSPEQLNNKFSLIYGSVNQLDYMLDNISLLDKNARGLLRYNPAEIVLEDEIQQIVDELHSIMGNTQRIKIIQKEKIGFVKMDPMLLRHIATNLLSNALKFSDDSKPVTFEITKLPTHKIKFDITDKGIGIRKNELENIWEPFFRGSNSEGIKGTGIGISIVKNCTDLCRGDIRISSVYQKGTTVSVVLPYEG